MEAELLEVLKKQTGYQRGAWERVMTVGRQYASMKSFGTYMEDDRVITVSARNVEDMTELFQGNLLRAVVDAFAEEARTGAMIGRLAGAK